MIGGTLGRGNLQNIEIEESSPETTRQGLAFVAQHGETAKHHTTQQFPWPATAQS